MGVENFWSFLQRHAPQAFEEIGSSSLAGRRLCVDAAVVFTSAFKATVLETPGWESSFAEVVLSRLQALASATGHTPTIVLDGPHPAAKAHAHARRESARATAQKRLDASRANGDADAIQRAFRATARFTGAMQDWIVAVLRAAGVDIIQAPGEAETHCAQLCRRGEFWAVVTEDSDALVCGAPRVLRGACRAGGGWTVVSLQASLRELGFVSASQLRWMSALAGTDFHPGLPSIGCVRARKLLLSCGGIISESTILDLAKGDKALARGLCVAESQFGDWEEAEAAQEQSAVEDILSRLQQDIVYDALQRCGGGSRLDFAAASAEFDKQGFAGRMMLTAQSTTPPPPHFAFAVEENSGFGIRFV